MNEEPKQEQQAEVAVTLYDIQRAIVDATEALERSAYDDETAGALGLAVESALMARGEKLDAVAWAVFDVGRRADELDAIAEARALANRADEQRIRSRATEIRKAIDTITSSALRVLMSLPLPKKGVRTLEGKTSTFKATKGRESVDVYDAAAVPREYCDVTITLTHADYLNLFAVMESVDKGHGVDRIRDAMAAAKLGAPSKTKLKPELERFIPCPMCIGDIPSCPNCGGLKQVPSQIPGARLEPAKYSVKIT